MKIVCIAWGSLLWKPGALKLASAWQPGGPRMPLEFTRNSDDSDELALVIDESAALMPTCWAELATGELGSAVGELRQREKISTDHPEWVGIAFRAPNESGDARVSAWLATQAFDAAIWTALPPKYRGIDGCAPTVEEAVSLLAGMRGQRQKFAEDYIRQVPAAIRTAYRQRFEQELGWTAVSGC